MNKIENFNYKLNKYDSTYGNTRLELNINGSNIDYVLINTLRRVILTYIPNHAFTDFTFKQNTSVFNNNYIKLRINNIPVWGIDNNIDIFVPNKLIKKEEIVNDNEIINNNDDDVDLNIEGGNINNSTLKQLTMFIDYKSNEKDIVTVSTDHAKFYYEEKKIEIPYKIPIPIIKLQPGQSITFSAITTIGIEKINSIYSVVSVCFYKELNSSDFDFIVESRGSINEKKIIHIGLINIINKLKNFIKNIPNNLDDSKLKGEIIIINEDATLGNLISHGMQSHKKVNFAGFNVPHLLEEKVVIHYELLNNTKINNVINDVVEYYIEIYEKMIDKNKLIKVE